MNFWFSFSFLNASTFLKREDRKKGGGIYKGEGQNPLENYEVVITSGRFGEICLNS